MISLLDVFFEWVNYGFIINGFLVYFLVSLYYVMLYIYVKVCFVYLLENLVFFIVLNIFFCCYFKCELGLN